ncbi:MAG: tetratricopeptide repeat protein [Rhodospirillaceae bacterium]|jgi:tetratricopeptide (TPR) repeat protein|nr:tetratricopeptide repeat protein [Rhodospirillaceae bacterium]
MNRAEKRRQQKKAKKTGASPGGRISGPGLGAPNIQQILDAALQHHGAGRLPEAERGYQQVIQLDPKHPVALHLLGVAAQQSGKVDLAVDLIRKAVAVAPDYAEAHYNLGAILHDLGKLDEAAASYHRALAHQPDYAKAHFNLGNTLKELGKLDDAAASYGKALALQPDYAKAYYNLGVVLHMLNRLDDAAASYQRVLAIEPNYAEAHFNLGNALNDLERPDAAAASYGNAIAIRPDYAEAHNNLGNALKDLGRLDEALAHCRRALSIKPDFAEAHYNLGVLLQKLGKPDAAAESYLKALAIKPDFAEAHNDLGNALQDLGKLDEARANYSKALAINPDFAEAHRHLSIVKKFTEYDDDIQAMERSYAAPGISDEHRMLLAFGLGKAFEDLQQYEKAFDCFAEGNAIVRGSYDYSIEGHGNDFKKIEAVFDVELFARHDSGGCSDETPVFIVGLPRSGTTLVEQILASHPQVHGAGELELLGRIASDAFGQADQDAFAENIRGADDAALQRLGAEYIGEVRKLGGDSRFVTDKMPGNHLNIGLIKLILPNAKVIHCKRHPADNGLSLFKSYFPVRSHYYAYDLVEIGRFYKFYSDLMAHWHSTLPGFVHDIQYEDVVADQAGQTRKLLEYCGMEWDDACLAFHTTDRSVTTASAVQVRQPIYSSSVQAWKRYETQLTPMLESLGQLIQS